MSRLINNLTSTSLILSNLNPSENIILSNIDGNLAVTEPSGSFFISGTGHTGPTGPQGDTGPQGEASTVTGPTGTFSNISTANTGSVMLVNPIGSNNIFYSNTLQTYRSLNNNIIFSVGPDIRGQGQTGAAMIINCTGYNNGIFYDNSSATLAYAANVITTINQIMGPGVTTNNLQWYWRDSTTRYFGNIVSSGSFFTGQHQNYSDNINIQSINESIGLIVVSNGTYLQQNKMIQSPPVTSQININEALPKIELSSSRNQKNVFGVISNWDNETQGYDENGNIYLDYSNSGFGNQNLDGRIRVNSCGEGSIWVCNINGNLVNGDLITTCEIPGYGMRQDDDLIHSYTVGKITCDCNFDLNSSIYTCEEFQYNGVTYRKAFVGCCYKCS